SMVLPLVAAAVVLAAVRSMATTLAGGGPLPDGSPLPADCFVYSEIPGNHPARALSTCPPGQSAPCFSAKFFDCTAGDPTCDVQRRLRLPGTRLPRIGEPGGVHPTALPGKPALEQALPAACSYLPGGLGLRGVRRFQRDAEGTGTQPAPQPETVHRSRASPG